MKMKGGILLVLIVGLVLVGSVIGATSNNIYVNYGKLVDEIEGLVPPLTHADHSDLGKYPEGTKKYWDDGKKLEDSVKNAFVEEFSEDAIKILDAAQITESKELREILMKKEVWDKIKNGDVEKVKKIVKTILDKDFGGKTIKFNGEVDLKETEWVEIESQSEVKSKAFLYMGTPIPLESSRIVGYEIDARGNVLHKLTGGEWVTLNKNQMVDSSKKPYLDTGQDQRQAGGSGQGGKSDKIAFAEIIGQGISAIAGAIGGGDEGGDSGGPSQEEPLGYGLDEFGNIAGGTGSCDQLTGDDRAACEAYNPQLYAQANPNGGEFSFEDYLLSLDDGSVGVDVAQNNMVDDAYVNVLNDNSLSEIETSNSFSTWSVNNELVANVYTPNEPVTSIGFDASSGGFAESDLGYGITAAAISDISVGQYVNFIGHDLRFGGERILVSVFKSFEEVNGDGENLWIRNGDTLIRFEGPKTYYPRKIRKSKYNLELIKNLRDDKNHFKLVNYREEKGRLLDGSGRVSVGDMAIEHPRKIGLKVARVREDMWVGR